MRNIWPDIIAQCRDHGFDDVGVSPLHIPKAQQDEFIEFLRQERAGTMAWLVNNVERRLNPDTLMEHASSAIMVGMNYAPDYDPFSSLSYSHKGVISCYAGGDDYHDVIKKRLIALGAYIHTHYDATIRVFVDTAPVLEKILASQAGIGWRGKHTNIVSRDFGSWLFLGVIVTSLPADNVPLSSHSTQVNHCGTCQQCLDICPTKAFDSAYRIDPRKCISYLTIEHKGVIDPMFYKAMGNRIYGCDDCLAICPWNKFATPTTLEAFKPRAHYATHTLLDFLQFDDAAFRACFRKSPIKRIGHTRFIRNCLIAASNDTSYNYNSIFTYWATDDDTVIAKTAQLILDAEHC